MAIGIVIGAAFSTIVKSLVDDIIMPTISWILKVPDFSNLFFVLSNPTWEKFLAVNTAREAGASVLAYWLFLNAVLAFLIVSMTLFFVVKAINKLKKDKPTTNKKDIKTELDILIEIRDSLKK